VDSEEQARPQTVTGSTQIPTPGIVIRNYLSTQHLYAARYAAEDAHAVEAAWKGPTVFDIRHRGYVLTAVIESVAFLEALINELYQDSADGQPSHIGALSPECIRLMAEMWRSTNRARFEMFEKFDLALVFTGQARLNRASAPYHDTALLVRLRNYLVHYKPEGVSVDLPHKLGEALARKFHGSALMQGAGNPWFPGALHAVAVIAALEPRRQTELLTRVRS
jgi:hypothetical protein